MNSFKTFCINYSFPRKICYVNFCQNVDLTKKFVPRNFFNLPTQFDHRTWYPKHMGVQLKRMEGKLRTVDLIIEVI